MRPATLLFFTAALIFLAQFAYGEWRTMHVFVTMEDDYPRSEYNITGHWHGQAFQDRTVQRINAGANSFFIDLAANNAVRSSNTLALERDHGWSGICIEANPIHWWSLLHRKCHLVGNVISSQKSTVKFDFTRDEGSGIVGKEFDIKSSAHGESRTPVSIKTVLQRYNVPKRIDYLSLDVEGAEWDIMSTFPFNEYTIISLSVERPNKHLQQLLEEKGLRFVRVQGNFGDMFFLSEQSEDYLKKRESILKEVELECSHIVRFLNSALRSKDLSQQMCVKLMTDMDSSTRVVYAKDKISILLKRGMRWYYKMERIKQARQQKVRSKGR